MDREVTEVCMHGESEVSRKKARFQCAKCGALTAKKSHACKPGKISDKEGKPGKGTKKKKKDGGKKGKSAKKKK